MLEITKADIDAIETELEGINFDNARREALLDNTSFDVQASQEAARRLCLQQN